ncbi:MAG: exodeoxyribonuclease VII large subunit [Planctomycetota bacterium]
MPGHIELDGRDLKIRFDYDPRLVEAVRMLPNRRFDPRQRLWVVPVRHVDTVVSALLPLGFEMSAEVRGLARPLEAALPFAADDLVDRAPLAGTAAVPAPEPSAWSISTLNLRVRDALRGAFVDGVWVVGEVVDFDKSAGRRHRHFVLVEKAPGEARPVAQVEAVLFGDTMEMLAHKLDAAKPPLHLRDGLEIRVRARVDLYPQAGRFQLIVDDIDPEHTLGKLALTREQILRELRAQGLDRLNLAKSLPRPALRLAVLASPTSDGWHDFAKQLSATGLAFAATLYPVRVQGVELRRTILAGLAYFAARAEHHDAVCILRGGGGRSDLSWFDDRELAFAVAKHPLKVLIGIGHERDRTVLDSIAQSFKTPTALAAHLAEEALAEWQALRSSSLRLADAAAARLAETARTLREHARGLQTMVAGHLVSERHALAMAAQRLGHAALSRRAARARRGLALAAQRLQHASRDRVQLQATALARAAARLRDDATRRLERSSEQLARHEVRCRLLDPRRVLLRGYAMVRHGGSGRLLTQASAVGARTRLLVEFRDGTIEVESTEATILPPSRLP